MTHVYLLQHSYEYGYDMEFSETKIIGIYKTREAAEETLKHYMNLTGFKEHSIDDFYIAKYELDKNHWEEGFISKEAIV